MACGYPCKSEHMEDFSNSVQDSLGDEKEIAEA